MKSQVQYMREMSVLRALKWCITWNSVLFLSSIRLKKRPQLACTCKLSWSCRRLEPIISQNRDTIINSIHPSTMANICQASACFCIALEQSNPAYPFLQLHMNCVAFSCSHQLCNICSYVLVLHMLSMSLCRMLSYWLYRQNVHTDKWRQGLNAYRQVPTPDSTKLLPCFMHTHLFHLIWWKLFSEMFCNAVIFFNKNGRCSVPKLYRRLPLALSI